MTYHYASCDAEAIGRKVLHIAATGQEFVTIGELTTDIDSWRVECGCYSRQLNRITDELRRARRGVKTGRPGSADLVARLIAERDALIASVTEEDDQA